MVLTGKAEEDFYKWYNCREGNTLTNNDLFYYSEELIQNALIIEWFDSLEYKENNTLWNHCFSICYWHRGMKEYKEATKQAIIKANEIYNEQQ